MDMFDKLRKAVVAREENDQRDFEEKSKDRLFKVIKKKLETTFIGDIAAIEKSLGKLWGQEYHDDDLTKEEREAKKIWTTLRNNILDRGNAQIRGIKAELEQHTIQWNGYEYNFIVGKGE